MNSKATPINLELGRGEPVSVVLLRPSSREGSALSCSKWNEHWGFLSAVRFELRADA